MSDSFPAHLMRFPYFPRLSRFHAAVRSQYLLHEVAYRLWIPMYTKVFKTSNHDCILVNWRISPLYFGLRFGGTVHKPNPKDAATFNDEREQRSLSRGEDAYQKILEAIQAGNLKPGTRLREQELAEWLGISRTPVREALNRLQTEGLVIQEPRRGMIIAELDHSMVSELYFMREVLEGAAARLAARHASDVEIAMLRDIADRDKDIAGDPVKLAKNNRLFHESLYRAAHNRYLLKTLSLLRESMALLGQTTLSLPERSKTALSEHEALVSAIELHDAAAAEEASRKHIRAAHRARMKLMFERFGENETE